MYESDEEYSFVVLSRVNSLKKVQESFAFWTDFRAGENPKWKFIGR